MHGVTLIGAEVPQEEEEKGCEAGHFLAGNHPRVIVLNEKEARVLPLAGLDVKVSCNLSVAFVTMVGEWIFDAGPSSSSSPVGFIFEVPKDHRTVVTHAKAVLASGKAFEVHVVEEAVALAGFKQNEGSGMALAMNVYKKRSGFDPTAFNPIMFSLPFHGASLDERIRVEVSYMVSMDFVEGSYELNLPLGFEFFESGKTFSDVVDIKVSLGLPRFLCPESMGMTGWRSSGVPLIRIDQGQEEDSIALQVEGSAAAAAAASEDGSELVTVEFQLDKSQPVQKGSELNFSFLCWSQEVGLQALHEKSPVVMLKNAAAEAGQAQVEAIDGGVVSVFVTPPPPQTSGSVPRDVVFILDRSGSMGFTKVFPDAKASLLAALKQLRPEDRFAICCFDDRQLWFGGCDPSVDDEMIERLADQLGFPKDVVPQSQPKANDDEQTGANNDGNFATVTRPFDVLKAQQSFRNQAPAEQEASQGGLCVRANESNIKAAIDWVENVNPAGLTDILTPIKQGFWGLFNNSKSVASCNKRLKSIFLITDGAVDNESQVCLFAGRMASMLRIFAFGIGVDCNAYFLRKLASIGRGYADVCVSRHSLQNQMVALFSKAQLPVLRDLVVELSMPPSPDGAKSRVDQLVWTPNIAPDLYCHAPIVVSCAYQGELPSSCSLIVKGTLADGTEWSKATPLADTGISLRQIFVQQHVEMLLADSWLAGLKTQAGLELRRQCVELALAEGFPMPYTQMVAIETTDEEKDTNTKSSYLDLKKRRLQFNAAVSSGDKKTTAILLGGSVAAGLAFGSVAATLAGGMATTMDAAGDAADAGDCCDDCCDDCDCGDCF